MRAHVWVVRAGSRREVESTIALEESHLVVTAEDEGTTERIPLKRMTRARRVFGSPVLVIDLAGEGLPSRLIVYFAPPPPLDAEGFRARRKERRRNATYLGAASEETLAEIKAWVRAIRAARTD